MIAEISESHKALVLLIKKLLQTESYSCSLLPEWLLSAQVLAIVLFAGKFPAFVISM